MHFTKLENFFKNLNGNSVAVTTNGAAAMVGKHKELNDFIRQKKNKFSVSLLHVLLQKVPKKLHKKNLNNVLNKEIILTLLRL